MVWWVTSGKKWRYKSWSQTRFGEEFWIPFALFTPQIKKLFYNLPEHRCSGFFFFVPLPSDCHLYPFVFVMENSHSKTFMSTLTNAKLHAIWDCSRSRLFTEATCFGALKVLVKPISMTQGKSIKPNHTLHIFVHSMWNLSPQPSVQILTWPQASATFV